MISGCFLMVSPKVIDVLVDDSAVWERELLAALAEQHQLSAYQHEVEL